MRREAQRKIEVNANLVKVEEREMESVGPTLEEVQIGEVESPSGTVVEEPERQGEEDTKRSEGEEELDEPKENWKKRRKKMLEVNTNLIMVGEKDEKDVQKGEEEEDEELPEGEEELDEQKENWKKRRKKSNYVRN